MGGKLWYDQKRRREEETVCMNVITSPRVGSGFVDLGEMGHILGRAPVGHVREDYSEGDDAWKLIEAILFD